MTDGESARPPNSTREVLAYFVSNPQAIDSLEGVARWRVQQEIVRHSVEQVGRALEWLVGQGFLVCDLTARSAPTYRLNQSMATEAAHFLAEEPHRDHVVPALTTTSSGSAETSRPSVSSLMSASFAWIDAALLRYHRQHPPSSGDLPGLSKSHGSIESALTPRVVSPETPSEGAGDYDQAVRDLESALATADHTEPLAMLYRSLNLTLLDLQSLLLCLAPELDSKYQSVYGVLNDDLGRRAATLGLVCSVLGDPLAVRTELTQSGALTRWRLLEHGAALPHADEPLRPDSAIVAWLLGEEQGLVREPRVTPLVRGKPWAGATWLRGSDEISLIERLRDVVAERTSERWIALAGGEKNGARAAIEAAAQLAGVPLLRMVLPSPGPTDPEEIADISTRLARASRLMGVVPILDITALPPDALGSSAMPRLLADLIGGTRSVIVITRSAEGVVGALAQSPGQCIHVELSSDAALAGVYAAASHEANLQIADVEAERLALAFPMSLDDIQDAIGLVTLKSAALPPSSEHFALLSTACRRIASPDLPRFGRRVEPVFRLADVVLPQEEHAQLSEIITHVRHASQVLREWGFREQLPYGRGVTALFSGPSGAGKTMAAQAIARELNTEAYVVDLSRVVSKYIGESEKNLDSVFTDAERAGVVVCFDEADALFGKRSEIKDAHDRYANIEVAFLLQRMEAFAGLAILTTNFRQNLDTAFVRRIRFIVDFKRPDEKLREAIWRRCLVAPLAENVNIPFLARRLEVTGGTIQQIALRSAFAAAAAQSDVVNMTHILTAAKAELLKLGLTSAARDLDAFEGAFRPAQEVA